MSIPSSPPCLPEELFNDPPSSPPLAPTPWPSRKRHADYESSLSSDPIFSEDASEDYTLNGAFKKKKYTKGPWFRPTSLALQKAAASSSRNHDSGVWMGSDSSTDSIGGCDRRVQTLSFQDFAVKRAPAIAPASKARGPEDIAADIVFNCVESCQETIDLSEMRLHRIPSQAIRPLHQLIRLPIDMNDTQKITPHHYAPLTPEIKLFLAKNELTSLPPELWNLGNITVLSLRNNELHELPPFVSRLRSLQELNVAGNQLKWLPWELLDLMTAYDRKLLRVSLTPNPFVHPCATQPSATLGRLRTSASAKECAKAIRHIRMRFPNAADSDSTYEALLIRLHETRLHQILDNEGARDTTGSGHTLEIDSGPVYVASSKIAFLDFDGSMHYSPMSRSRTEPTFLASLHSTPPPSQQTTAVPSLFELSARACARSPFIKQLTSILPEDASPPVDNALRKAIESREIGFQKCTICRKQYVIPRAEWMEYWFDGRGLGEQFLPFLRKSCSWRCVRNLNDSRMHELDAVKQSVAQVDATLEGMG